MPVAEVFSPGTIRSAKNEVEYSLSERINISTRSPHSRLNRLIIARFPLALPPYTSNPSRYVSGLLYIAPIYITFESLWQEILPQCLSTTLCGEITHGSGNEDRPPIDFHSHKTTSPPTQPITIRKNTHSILSRLLLPELLRSDRLRADITTLSGRPLHEIEESLVAISQNGTTIADFVEHIRNSVVTNPHVLVAYAWVFYMALFSGGRYLRASLESAGMDFWLSSPSQPPSPLQPTQDPSHPSPTSEDEQQRPDRLMESRLEGLNSKPESLAPRTATTQEVHQFFHFPGVEDGEDIKREFKARMAETEKLLSDQEKEDIIKEANHIFAFMLGIVGDLDAVTETVLDQEKQTTTEQPHSVSHGAGHESCPFARGSPPKAKQTSRSEGQDASRPSVFRASSRMAQSGTTALGRIMRELVWMSSTRDRLTINAPELQIGSLEIASLASLPLFFLAFIAWYFT